MLTRLSSHRSVPLAANRALRSQRWQTAGSIVNPVDEQRTIGCQTNHHPSLYKHRHNSYDIRTTPRFFSSQPPGGGGGGMPMPPWMNPEAAKPGQHLEQYTIDLTALAADNKLDPVIGRHEEIRRCV
jgi:ATP-dependent Clp protease ATP-binding subunit ClpA